MLHKAQLTVTILSKVVRLLVFDITKVTGCVELRNNIILFSYVSNNTLYMNASICYFSCLFNLNTC